MTETMGHSAANSLMPSISLPRRHSLARLPTPLVEAKRLSTALGGPRILIKRDDMTGFGFGGNKIRKLEFYLVEALAEGADVIVTGAGPQSNHVRATAAAARVVGMEAVVVLHGSAPDVIQGNFLLDRLLGAEARFTDSPDRSRVDQKIEEAAEELRRAGRRPYVIPRGGASALGSLGYVECVRELGIQLADKDLHPDWVVLATGSCGTQAGLLAGAKLYDVPYRMLGITVSRHVAECRERIDRIARQASELAGHPIELSPGDIVVRDEYIGPGYGIPTPECIEAIRLVARTEGLFLDPTYTGKGMAGLIGEIRSGRIGKDETVIFVHTGGEPGLFAHPEIGESPA
jgi:D-cysteine desulfhydrase family pyridoxal phosphate-dependent enzyme